MQTVDIIVNVMLPVFSCGGAMLVTSINHRTRLYGYILGLLSQPLWAYVAYTSGSWGMYVTVAFYTMAWLRGVISHSLKRAWFPRATE